MTYICRLFHSVGKSRMNDVFLGSALKRGSKPNELHRKKHRHNKPYTSAAIKPGSSPDLWKEKHWPPCASRSCHWESPECVHHLCRRSFPAMTARSLYGFSSSQLVWFVSIPGFQEAQKIISVVIQSNIGSNFCNWWQSNFCARPHVRMSC